MIYDVGGYYMYIEASGNRHNGDKARLETPSYHPTQGAMCLNFWYHMYGAHINTLNVYTHVGASLGSPVWTKRGTQGNAWKNAQVTINVTTSFSVRLRYN